MAREIPFSAIQMTIYEIVKNIRQEKDHEPEFIDHAVNGSISGSLAAFLTTPVDVIKTQRMTDRTVHPPTTTELCQMVYRESGIGGFFKAWHLRSINLAICSIVFFATYENSKIYLNRKFNPEYK